MTGRIIVPEREVAQMGYGFTPGSGRRDYTMPLDDPLAALFEKWLEMVPTDKFFGQDKNDEIVNRVAPIIYQAIYETISELPGIKERMPEDINSLAIKNKNHKNIAYAGLFLSACYNAIESPEIVFDVVEAGDFMLDFIGYRLSKDKTLFVKSDTGWFTGMESEGSVINYAKVEMGFGDGSKGNLVNYGTVRHMANGASGRVLNYGRAHHLGSLVSGIVINFGKVLYQAIFNRNISINFNFAKQFGENCNGVNINFGRTRQFGKDSRRSVLINAGNANEMGFGVEDSDHVFSIDLSKPTARRQRKIKNYMKELKQKLEAYKNSGYPECLGVFDIVEQEIVDMEKFEQKIRGMI